LEDLGVDVSEIPALQSLPSIQSRSSEKSCSIAVSEKFGSVGAIISDSLGLNQY
jgi:hypothetical protein